MKTASDILRRQGYRPLVGACAEPAEIWQGPDGRRVLLEEGRIYNRQDIERRARDIGEDRAGYYHSIVRNWG